ncbi:hypothetical protein PRJ_Fausto_00266 [Faustovirus]|nr:hypothetical protein PRJ_Fausto_00266 [Faustovirus]AMN84185.1 hypothetical protein D5a_00280 [Faustovirus]QBR99174.1 hypothetical protein [Faustovirus mariensis]
MNQIKITCEDFDLILNHVTMAHLESKTDSKYVVFGSENILCHEQNGEIKKMDKQIAFNGTCIRTCDLKTDASLDSPISYKMLNVGYGPMIEKMFVTFQPGEKINVMGDRLHAYTVISWRCFTNTIPQNGTCPLRKAIHIIAPKLFEDVDKRDAPKAMLKATSTITAGVSDDAAFNTPKMEPQVIIPAQSALPPVATETEPKDVVKAESAATNPLLKPIYAFEEARFHGLKVWKLTSHCNSYASVKISFGVVPADMKLINVSKVTNTITPIVVKKDMDHVMINPNTNSMFWFTNMTGSDIITPDISDYELVPM